MPFNASLNSIVVSREYFMDFSCTYDLVYYPFDTQMCEMVMNVQGKTDDYVKLEKDGLGVDFVGADGTMLVEYEIQKWVLEIKVVNKVSVAEVKIVFRRRIEYHVTNTMLQTLILIFVGYMSFHFGVEDFGNRIMVSLTTMLVIATSTSRIQSDLPKTSNFKMIDWWLFFSSNVLVVTLCFHTFLAYVCSHAKAHKEQMEKGNLNLKGVGAHQLPIRLPKLFQPGAKPGLRRRQQQQQQQQQQPYRGISAATSRTVSVASMVDPIQNPPPLHPNDEKAGGGMVHGEVRRIEDEIVVNQDQGHQPHADDHDHHDHHHHHDPMVTAHRLNTFGKVAYLGLVFVFNLVFWTIAIVEYVRPAEEYLWPNGGGPSAGEGVGSNSTNSSMNAEAP